LIVFVAFAVLIVGLILLERSGPAPVHPLFRTASSSRDVTSGGHGDGSFLLSTPVVPNTANNPNKHCDDGKGKDADQNKHCRPPSGEGDHHGDDHQSDDHHGNEHHGFQQ